MSLRPSSGVARELLGAHVIRRPDDVSRLRHFLRLVARRLGDAEVDDFDEVVAVARLRDHDVVRLEIAVDNSHVVSDGERLAPSDA